MEIIIDHFDQYTLHTCIKMPQFIETRTVIMYVKIRILRT